MSTMTSQSLRPLPFHTLHKTQAFRIPSKWLSAVINKQQVEFIRNKIT